MLCGVLVVTSLAMCLWGGRGKHGQHRRAPTVGASTLVLLPEPHAVSICLTIGKIGPMAPCCSQRSVVTIAAWMDHEKCASHGHRYTPTHTDSCRTDRDRDRAHMSRLGPVSPTYPLNDNISASRRGTPSHRTLDQPSQPSVGTTASVQPAGFHSVDSSHK